MTTYMRGSPRIVRDRRAGTIDAERRDMKLTVVLATTSLLITSCAARDADPIEDPSADDNDGPVDGGDLSEEPAELAGCTSSTTVVLYSEATFEFTLPNAFAAAQEPCTRYYVQLPHLNPDTTMPRPDADKVHQLGPNFRAAAEFSWSGWARWIAESPGTRSWSQAGKLFRQRMVDAGYDVARGDTWVINEFPSTTRSGEGDVWTNERAVVKALFEGNGATSQGIVLLAGMGQGLQNFSVYKPNVKNWLAEDAFWNAMKSYVRWFSYEVYADPHYDCVVGSNVIADANHLNEYLEHLPRIAAAGGAQTATAAAYLARSYLPLVNAAWNSNNGFGDNVIGLEDFAKFSRLQIYATHVWAANHNFPGRRLGFAWAPKNSTRDQENELAGIIARSFGRAYRANRFYNLGKLACSTDGSLDGCGCTVSGSYNPGWQAFATY